MGVGREDIQERKCRSLIADYGSAMTDRISRLGFAKAKPDQEVAKWKHFGHTASSVHGCEYGA